MYVLHTYFMRHEYSLCIKVYIMICIIMHSISPHFYTHRTTIIYKHNNSVNKVHLSVDGKKVIGQSVLKVVTAE